MDREAIQQIEQGTYVPKILWKIPAGYLSDFKRDPIKAKRDLGAEPSKAIQAYYPDPNIVAKRTNRNRTPPWDDLRKQFHPDYKCNNKKFPRYVHIDLAQKKDAAGLAMGYRSGYISVDGESRPKVYIDVMIRIQAPKGGEIKFSDVRQIVYTLQELGFPIVQVSFDGWQSVDSIQILNSRGIQAIMQSVDRTIEPHETLKSCLLDDRLDFYEYEVRDRVGTDDERTIVILEEEVASLELINGTKVDHAAKSSKDVADAVAGVCFFCAQDAIQAAANPGITLI